MSRTNNRAKLIASTQKLMHTKGYDRTSLAQIMEEAEVCKSNFYYYFRNKEEAGLTATKKMIKDFCEKILGITLLNKDLDPYTRLEAFQNTAIALHRTYLKEYDSYPGCFFGNLTLEQSGNPAFAKLLKDFFKKWTDALRGTLEEGVKQGCFTTEISPEEITILIVSQMEGSILISRATGDIEPFVETCKSLREIIAI